MTSASRPGKPRHGPADGTETFRDHLPAFVGDHLEIASLGYHDFARRPVPQDTRGCAQHHAACKAILAHIEALLRLGRWTGGDGDGRDGPLEGETTLDDLLGAARAAIADFDGDDTR